MPKIGEYKIEPAFTHFFLRIIKCIRIYYCDFLCSIAELRKDMRYKQFNDIFVKLDYRDGINVVFCCCHIGEVAKPKTVRKNLSMCPFNSRTNGVDLHGSHRHPYATVLHDGRIAYLLGKESNLRNYPPICPNTYIIENKGFKRFKLTVT